MSEVKFSANPSAVLKALSDIQRALDRTSQAGRKFSELDFGNPQIAKLEDRMRTLKAQMDAFLRVSPNSAMARGLRNSGQMGRDPWHVNWVDAFPDPGQRARALGRLGQLPQQFGGMPPGGAGYGGARQGGISLPGMLPMTPAGIAGGIVGIALGGSIAKAIADGVGRAREHDQSADTALRWSGVARDFETLRAEIGAVGKGLGLMEHEGAKLATAFAAASGSMETSADGARVAMGIAAGYGLEAEPTARRFGSMEFLGAAGPQSATSMREFAGILSETIARGGMGSRGEQVLADLAGSVEKLTASSLSPQNIATLAGFHLATYEQAKQNPGLRAVGPGGVMDVLGGFASYASDSLEKTMMQFAALEHLTTNLGLQRRMIEAGPFSRPGEMVGSGDSRTLIEMLMQQARAMTRGMDPHMAKAAMAEIMGTTTPMVEAIEKILVTFTETDFENLDARLKASGMSLENMDVGGFAGAASVIAAQGNDAELAAIREQMIASAKLDDTKAAELRAKSGDELVTALVGLAAQEGRVKTPHSELTEAISDLGDDFAKLGGELNRARTDLVKAMADLTDPLQKIVGFWDGAKAAVDGKSLIDDGGLLSMLTYSPLAAGAVDLGKQAWTVARGGRSGRSGRNRRPGSAQDAAEAPADDAGNPLLDWLFNPAEAATLPFASAFDVNPPLSPGQRMARSLPAPAPSVASTVMTGARGRVLDMIAGPESGGNYDAWYSNANQSDVDLSTMTINEVQELQKELVKQNGGSAIGRYQIIPKTMALLKSRLALTGDELFTDELQDRMAISLAQDAGLVGWEKGVVQDEEFAFNLSKIWAGLPKDESGDSFYENDGLNSAQVSWDSVLSDLRSAKTQRDIAPPAIRDAIDAAAPVDENETYLRSLLDDALPKDITPPGDKVSQRIGQGLRQEPTPPIALSLAMYQNPVTGAFHVEADRQGSGATRIAYGAGQWDYGRPRATS